MPRLNIRALVTDMGGKTKLSNALKDQNLASVAPVAILRWCEKSRTSSDHLAAIMVLGDRAGKPIDLKKYLVTE
jgi:hypothetical protein